ncbi:MAG: ABC transporter permease, partial [Chitinophagaceae bacterium]|nr:ABC transporter permease [Chitinophagaceae bacterium]
ETFGLKLLEGRQFTPQIADTVNTEVIVTEEAVKLMGFKEPIGAVFTIGDANCVIIGVVNDFHTESLRNEKFPVVFYMHPILNCSSLFVKYEPGATQQSLEIIQSAYNKFEPTFTMKYSFQDEVFDTMYKTEITASKMVMLFTIIAMVIAIIGIVGLATYNVIKRKKEIGIKRVFGASIPNIFLMLSKEFALIVVLATMLAMPFTWYSASHWLSGFVYRIDMPWWIFVSTFAGICILTVLIIFVQGFKTVKTNPTKTLRSE